MAEEAEEEGEADASEDEAPGLPDGPPPLPDEPPPLPEGGADASEDEAPGLPDGPPPLPDEPPPLPEGGADASEDEAPGLPDGPPPLPDEPPPLPEGGADASEDEAPGLPDGPPPLPDEPPPLPEGRKDASEDEAPPLPDGPPPLPGGPPPVPEEAPPLAAPRMSTEVMWKALQSVGLTGASLGDAPTPSHSSAPKEPARPEPKAEPKAPAASSTGDVGGNLSGSALAGGHTPESIARLPPKLRQRLIQRGILKEEDVKLAMRIVMGGGPPPKAPAAAPTGGEASVAQSPGTPPEPSPPDAGVTGAVVKAKAPAPSGEAWAAAQAAMAQQAAIAQQAAMAQQAAAARVSEAWARAMAVAKSAPAVGTVVKAAPPAPSAPKAAPQQVYSSAPVLNKRSAEEQGGDAKRAKTEGVHAEKLSPADARAAAARAQGDKAPVWVYKDGAVSQAGQPATAAPGTPPEPSAPGTPSESGAPGTPPEPGQEPAMPPGAPPPPPGPPLPPGWVRVPHEDDFYYWNTSTNEVSWEHPAEAKEETASKKKEEKPKFTEEHRVLWTDLGKIIGRQGMNLKIIKASIGCEIHTPKQGGKDGKGGKGGKGGKDDKGKGKSKAKVDEKGAKIGRGIGDGSTKLADDMFCTVTVTADTAMKANGGKRCIEIMLGYNRQVERALADLGVEAKMPSIEEMTNGKAKSNKKDGIDPMDPAAYSDAPVGNWGSGMKKPGQKGKGGGRGPGPEPRDSKTANAERF
eukprot:TRINITY_DN5926_c0_g1_i3.p1 TRINITY_DN5926_c0_g1~~TRINITY_DN5926_c0_g1_i3.p1  ORF type:complete len:744 (-),score=228.05 TRINITY_DN5926_c0_g1_i3:60-2291(-)